MATKVCADQFNETLVTNVRLDQRYLTFTSSDDSTVQIDLLQQTVTAAVTPSFGRAGDALALSVSGGSPGATFTITERVGTGLSNLSLAPKFLDANGSYNSQFVLQQGTSLGLHEWDVQYSDGKASIVQFLDIPTFIAPQPPATIEDELAILDRNLNSLYSTTTQKWHVQLSQATSIQWKDLAYYGNIAQINVQKQSGPAFDLYPHVFTLTPYTFETTPYNSTMPSDGTAAGDYVYKIDYIDLGGANKKSYNIGITLEQPPFVPAPGPWDNGVMNVALSGGDIQGANISQQFFTNDPTNGLTSNSISSSYIKEQLAIKWQNLSQTSKIVMTQTGGPAFQIFDRSYTITGSQSQIFNVDTTNAPEGSYTYRVDVYNTNNIKVRSTTFNAAIHRTPKYTATINVTPSNDTAPPVTFIDNGNLSVVGDLAGSFIFSNMNLLEAFSLAQADSTGVAPIFPVGNYQVNVNSTVSEALVPPNTFGISNTLVANITYDQGRKTVAHLTVSYANYTVTLGATGSPSQLNGSRNGAGQVISDQANVTVTGGTPPYTYTWSSVSGSALFNSTNNPGPNDTTTYTKVADTLQNGATSSGAIKCIIKDSSTPQQVTNVGFNYRLVSAAAFSAAITPNPDSVSVEGGGAFTVTSHTLTAAVNGGTAPYTYVWSTSRPDAPYAFVNQVDSATSSSVQVSYPFGDTNSFGTQTANVDVTCTVKDANNQTVAPMANVTLKAVALMTASISPSDSTGGINGAGTANTNVFNVTVTNGIAPFTYTWTTTNGTLINGASGSANGSQCANQVSLPLSNGQVINGSVHCTVTDASGSSVSTSATYEFNSVNNSQPPAQLALVVNPTTDVINVTGAVSGALGRVLTATSSGGTGPYTYAWSTANGTFTNGASGSGTGTTNTNQVSYNITDGSSISGNITVRVTDSTAATVTVQVPYTYTSTSSVSPLNATLSPGSDSSSIQGSGTAISNTFTVNVSSGNAPYTYAWSTNNGTFTNGASGSGTGTTNTNKVSTHLSNGQTISGTVTCIVTDNKGQTTTLSSTYSYTSNYVAPIQLAAKVATATYQNYAFINNAGSIYGAGTNAKLVTANLVTSGPQQSFINIDALSWKSVAVGIYGMLRVRSDGTLWMNGTDYSGELGHATSSTPAQVGADTDWQYVTTETRSTSGGALTSFAIKTDGTLWAMGANAMGQLGTNAAANFTTMAPVQIPGSWTKVIVSYESVHGLMSDGTLWAWGNNSSGQLGINNTSSQFTPQQIPGNWTDVSYFGAYSGAAIKSDGTLWTFSKATVAGLNTGLVPLQLGTASDWFKVFNCSSTSAMLYALKNDNSLWVLGDNSRGGAGIVGAPATLSVLTQVPGSWADLISGNDSVIAIKTDGTVWGWGQSNGIVLSSTPTQLASV